jgi:hypothetical protein
MSYQETYKLENLIKWLETKPPDERYNYHSCRQCLLAQYLRYSIPEFVSIGVEWWSRKGERFSIPNIRILDGIAYKGEWTFGAALERAKCLV